MAGAVVRQGARAHLSRRAQGRRLAQVELPRNIRRGAPHRAGTAGSQARPGAAGRDPFRQQHRPRAARARRHARRHPGGADLAGVLADVEGFRQAQVHLRAAAARAGVRRRCGEIQAGAGGGRRQVGIGRGAAGGQSRLDAGTRARKSAARNGGEDPLHLGLHRAAERRDQHARDALRQPAAAGAGVALPRGPAAGAGRLAAVEPHLRRQLQLQSDPAQRRHAVHRCRQAGAGAGRDDGEEPGRDRAASTCCCPISRRTRRCAAISSASST